MNRNPNSHRSLSAPGAALLAFVAASIALIGASSSLTFGADPQASTQQPAPAKKPPAKKQTGKAATRPAQPAKPSDSSTPPEDEAQPTNEPRPSTAQRSFTDDDLEKYHKPKPAPDADAESVEADAAGPPAAVAPAAGSAVPGSPTAKPAAAKMATPKPAAAKTAAKKPKANVVPPPPDAATLALAKSALDAARARELKARRDRIEGFEMRLAYLRAKRDAIVNPTGAQVGTTGPRAYQYDQNGNPVLDPKTGKPVTKPDISPGHGTAPVAPMFVPLPEAQTDEDREKDKTMKVKDLLASVEAEIKSVEADLESARAELIEYETRFAPATGAP